MRSILTASVVALALMTASVAADDHDPAEDVKTLIEKAYVHGAFNELNPEALEKGFHPDFAIFSPDGENIRKFPIAKWVERTTERKADPEFDAAENKWAHRFASVDVTGNAASVKIELLKDGKLVYTDYLSLLKFDSGWRVVAKVYHRHED